MGDGMIVIEGGGTEAGALPKSLDGAAKWIAGGLGFYWIAESQGTASLMRKHQTKRLSATDDPTAWMSREPIRSS